MSFEIEFNGLGLGVAEEEGMTPPGVTPHHRSVLDSGGCCIVELTAQKTSMRSEPTVLACEGHACIHIMQAFISLTWLCCLQGFSSLTPFSEGPGAKAESGDI